MNNKSLTLISFFSYRLVLVRFDQGSFQDQSFLLNLKAAWKSLALSLQRTPSTSVLVLLYKPCKNLLKIGITLGSLLLWDYWFRLYLNILEVLIFTCLRWNSGSSSIWLFSYKMRAESKVKITFRRTAHKSLVLIGLIKLSVLVHRACNSANVWRIKVMHLSLIHVLRTHKSLVLSSEKRPVKHRSLIGLVHRTLELLDCCKILVVVELVYIYLQSLRVEHTRRLRSHIFRRRIDSHILVSSITDI